MARRAGFATESSPASLSSASSSCDGCTRRRKQFRDSDDLGCRVAKLPGCPGFVPATRQPGNSATLSMLLFQIDAFTSEPFKGNPAAVCFMDGERDDRWMANVAAEMNLAETAFLNPR